MKKFKCMNIGNCDHANNEAVFEIAEGEEQKCPKCGQTMLVEVKETNIGKLIGIIAAVLVVIGGAVGAIFALSGDSKPTAISLEQQEITLTVGEKGVVKATAEPADVKATFTYKATGKSIEVNAGGEITALKKGEATVIVKCEENLELRAVCKVTVNDPQAEEEKEAAQEEEVAEEEPVKEEEKAEETKKEENKTVQPKPQPAAKNPSWGRYDGARDANGLPNGNGILRITRSTTINGETAQPGERIEGVFRNGYVNMGTWYKNDGNAVVVKGIKVV